MKENDMSPDFESWIVKPKTIKSKQNYKYCMDLISPFHLCHSLPEDYYFYDPEQRSGIFVFGYYLPRLQNDQAISDLKELFSLLKKNKDNIHYLIKGIFTIIIITETKIEIINDPFGLSKFFYVNNEAQIIVSNRIKNIRDYTHSPISKDHVLEYYVFNYVLNGNTFYKDIRCAEPASRITLEKNAVFRFSEYFRIEDYLKKTVSIKRKKEVWKSAPELWLKLISQYQNAIHNKKASLTLTGGLDSRIILGSFLSSGNSNFETFTFGHKDSYDVITAKELAVQYQIPHEHVYPDNHFFDDYASRADHVFKNGDTMVSIYRAHRMDAYKQVMQKSDAIFMGMAGSDLVRGIGYDGLIVSPIAFHCWNKNSFESYFENQTNIQKLKNLGFNSIDPLMGNRDAYEYIKNPILYLFRVIIPLHFGQDVLMNYNMGWNTFLPFIDLDYLDFLRQSPYLQLMDYDNYKRMDLQRRSQGMKYSAILAKSLNNKLSKFTLGKGYSPDDIVQSLFLVYVKALKYKLVNRKKRSVANFSYANWYWNFLRNFLENMNTFEIGLNHDYLKTSLQDSRKEGGELYFLDYTKAVNSMKASQL